jgi:hypothetical protein
MTRRQQLQPYKWGLKLAVGLTHFVLNLTTSLVGSLATLREGSFLNLLFKAAVESTIFAYKVLAALAIIRTFHERHNPL